MNKKGVELSMNVIIIAAIGLLVLVILAVLVINSGGKFQGGTQTCTAKGGICMDACTGTYAANPNGGTCDGVNVCCTLFVATGG